jgi:hypothetical protein
MTVRAYNLTLRQHDGRRERLVHEELVKIPTDVDLLDYAAGALVAYRLANPGLLPPRPISGLISVGLYRAVKGTARYEGVEVGENTDYDELHGKVEILDLRTNDTICATLST